MMRMVVVVGILLLVVAGIRQKFRDDTGVLPPSSSAYRGIKKRACKKGIPTHEALDKWVENKQRRK